MLIKKSKKIINLLPRFFLALLLIAIFLQAAGLLFLVSAPSIAQAAKPLEMNLQVPIPGLNSHIVFSSDTGKIAEYVKTIYNYAVGIVGILAAVVLMIGGLMWITAGGNTSNISEAKAMITASLTGLVLVLTSYLLLSMVNPALVNLQSSIISNTGSITAPSTLKNCQWKNVQTYGVDYTGMGDAPILVGNCSDLKLAESIGGKDCDINKFKFTDEEKPFIKCCCEVVIIASGQCQKGSGSCAPENLTIFGSKAEQASAICQGESGGSPGIPSGTDICADGNPASWGLFQINISANKIGNLNCPSAFSSKYTASNHSCRVIDQNLYERCVNAAKDPATNINQAYIIYSQAGSKWTPWGFYHRACSQSF